MRLRARLWKQPQTYRQAQVTSRMGRKVRLEQTMAETTGKIAVLGVGRIGGALGRKWVAAGREVAFGVADLNGDKAQALKADIGDKASITSVADALEGAEIVVFAIPGKAMDETIATNAAALEGKLVFDCANRMGEPSFNSHATFQRLT